uniref:DUF1618 domain-containing protein n=1 Tax=Leersia perrieri TaxID=77586 RepID=A0A0D9WZ04_9ORYZ
MTATATAADVHSDSRWALLERSITVCPLSHPGAAAAATVSTTTSTGRAVRVSLHLATPPASSSCVHFYTDDPGANNKSLVRKPIPRLMAADEDLLLIHMTITPEGDLLDPNGMPIYYYRPDNFFVLNDWAGNPRATGIMRSGKGEEYVVASLMPDAVLDGQEERLVFTLWIYRSTTREWRSRQLDSPDGPHGAGECGWDNDAVFPFQGYMCWVNYHRGILFCKLVLDDDDDAELRLGFVPFPGIEMSTRDLFPQPDMYRTVSAVGGLLKFVDVDNGDMRSSTGGDCTIITTWTLRSLGLGFDRWELDDKIRLEDDLWSLPNYQESPLPRIVPRFPVFSMNSPNAVHFILNRPGYSDKCWMITVDMKNKSLASYSLYNKASAQDCDQDGSNLST